MSRVKRAILWLDKNLWPDDDGPGILLGAAIYLFCLFLLGVLFSPMAFAPTGTHVPFSVRGVLIGDLRVGVGGGSIGVLVMGYRATVRWAKSAPRRDSVACPESDDFLESAKREVEQIAPSDE